MSYRLFEKPDVFPFEWASDWGEDQYGLWVSFTYKEIRQSFRWIQPCTFKMGSPGDEYERDNDESLHDVILTKGYWIADTTCTQELWKVVMGKNPSFFKGVNKPVEQVSWDDCFKFIEKINKIKPGLNLRLPTEAEWENACRAGTGNPFSFGEDITPELVNYDGNNPYKKGKKGIYRKETVQVKSLPCNDWGLYEMHGNVWEWCQDWYDGNYYNDSTKEDPKGPDKGDDRVIRGGGWDDDAGNVRSAVRLRYRPDYRYYYTGFRLARGHERKGR